MDELLQDWITRKQAEAKDAFHQFDYNVIKSIMFAALYEEQYALDLINDRDLDERHIHAVCETDYCEEYYLKELNHYDGE
jgi:hypothetical protein